MCACVCVCVCIQWSNCKNKLGGDGVVGGERGVGVVLWLILHNDYKIGLIFKKVSI